MKKVIFSITLLIIVMIFSACQSRAISRLTGGALQLQIPKDFDRPISFASGRKGEARGSAHRLRQRGEGQFSESADSRRL